MAKADTHERLGLIDSPAAKELSSPQYEQITLNRDTLFQAVRILAEMDRPLDARWLVARMIEATGVDDASSILVEVITDAIVKGA